NIAGSEEIIGRETEIVEITTILRSSDKCLLTLTGAGGSGKTTLAQSVSKKMQSEFVDGVYFVELASITQSELFIGTLAKTLCVEESSNQSLLENVKNFVQKRNILLVLDNFEQLLVATNLLKEIYDSATNLKILVTSRAPLRLKFERAKLVVPLAVPPDVNLPAEQLNAFSAVELFIARAKTARTSFELNEENGAFVAEICKHLDGLPLAVELAAARVKLLSPQEIASRLENSLKLLTGGAKSLSERQRTMRGAIKWSYDLLDEDEQNLFRRLAVFAGGFTVEAAEVFGCRQLAESSKEQSLSDYNPIPTEVLDLLSSLIDNNLLISKEKTNGSMRLQLLEVVREFALERLENSGEEEFSRRIHSDFFLALAEEAEPLLHGEDGNEWLEKLETEYDNLRSALAWSLKNDGQTAAKIAAALRFFWLNRSYLSEGLNWSSAALQATENTISKARSDLLLSNGVFLRSQGNLEAARKFYEKTLTESRQLNDLLQIIKANHGLAAITVLQKDFNSAQTSIEEALLLSRQLKDEMQTAYSLASLGDLEMSRENLSVARPLLEECLTISKKLAHKKLLTVTYFNLGTIDYFENSFQAAAFNFAESFKIAEKMGNITMISCALEGFAALAVKSGKPEQSAKLAGAAESLRESIGYYIEPAEEIFRNNYLAETRAALSEKQFSTLYLQGKILNSDEAAALTELRTFDFSDDSDEEISEIIIETHSFERITIEEEIGNDFSNEIQIF
ncbi:MAG: NB-ARC domain-containing protein, partial [Acidobacteriota bacterium]